MSQVVKLWLFLCGTYIADKHTWLRSSHPLLSWLSHLATNFAWWPWVTRWLGRDHQLTLSLFESNYLPLAHDCYLMWRCWLALLHPGYIILSLHSSNFPLMPCVIVMCSEIFWQYTLCTVEWHAYIWLIGVFASHRIYSFIVTVVLSIQA